MLCRTSSGFQFVNTNAALFYVAVVKPSYESIRCGSSSIVDGNPWPEPCASYGCRLELSLELMVIMVGKQFFQNQMESYKPKLQTWWRGLLRRFRMKSVDDLARRQDAARRKEVEERGHMGTNDAARGTALERAHTGANDAKNCLRPCLRPCRNPCRNQKTDGSADNFTHFGSVFVPTPRNATDQTEPLLPWEDDFVNLAPTPEMDTFEDFLELALQFGFCTMYVSAFTLAPIFALINNVYEKKVDSTKMLRTFRRTVPYYASGIGVWEDILKTISVVGIIMQGLVLACTSELIPIMIFKGYFADVQFPLTGNWPDGQYGGDAATYISVSHDYNTDLQCSAKSFCKPPANNPDGDSGYTEYAYYLLVGRLVLFLVFEHIVVILKLLMTSFLPPMPMSLVRHKEVQNTVIEKVLNKAIYSKEVRNETSSDSSDDDTASPQKQAGANKSPDHWTEGNPNWESPAPGSADDFGGLVSEEDAAPDPVLAVNSGRDRRQASEGRSSSFTSPVPGVGAEDEAEADTARVRSSDVAPAPAAFESVDAVEAHAEDLADATPVAQVGVDLVTLDDVAGEVAAGGLSQLVDTAVAAGSGTSREGRPSFAVVRLTTI